MDLKAYVLQKVKEKKELSSLDDSFIIYELNEYLRIHKKARDIHSHFEKSNEVEKIIKYIRGKARTIFGVFYQKEYGKTVPLLVDDIPGILQTHKSTQERILFYADFFKRIFELTGEPKLVLDLACGLNPIAFFHYTNFTPQYFCNEIAQSAYLNDFFEKNSLNGSCTSFNIVKNLEKLKDFPPSDICFLLKTLDTLESQQLYVTYDILKAIQTKHFVVSFPLINVKGQVMQRKSHINWFEKMCGRLELAYDILEFENEIVYVTKSH